MALLTCRDAAFAYDGKPAVAKLDFAVNAGDYLCIVGENGSGKSTLVKGLLRLKPPSAGRVELGEGLRARDIGYLPQQTAAQRDFPASAYEVVLSGRLSRRGFRPFYARADREDAQRNMERLGVANLRNRCYRELSGGQQQRVLLARALCAATRLLILDEPVSGLDPVVTQELYRLIAGINADMGLAIVMVSHDVQGAMMYAKHILHLRSEQIFYGTAQAYAASGLALGDIGEGKA